MRGYLNISISSCKFQTLNALQHPHIFGCVGFIFYIGVFSSAGLQQVVSYFVGDKQVVYKDRLSLPYTEAVLLESLRIGNLVPNALPQMVEEDLILEGDVCL